jgi:hypothetical protein
MGAEPNHHPIISQDIIDVTKQLKPKHSLDPSNLSMVLIKKKYRILYVCH